MSSQSPILTPAVGDPSLDGATPVFEFVGANPRTAPGIDRPQGSVARFASAYYLKVGPLATDWMPIPNLFGATAIDGTTLSPTSIDIGDANVDGTADTLARADHQHAFAAPVAAPPAIAAAGAVGVLTTPARSDHTHAGVTSMDGSTGALVTGSIAPAQIDSGDAAVLGTASTFARADHQHALLAPDNVLQVAAASSVGVSPKVARQDHVHVGVTSLDNVIAGLVPTGSLNPAQIDLGDALALGTTGTVARADHQHAFPAAVGAPPAIAAAGAVGVATTPARSDHTHAGVTSFNGNQGVVTGVDSVNGLTGALTVTLDRFQVDADMLLDPDSADWAINGAAVLAADTTNAAFRVRQFTNVNDLEGVGWERYIQGTYQPGVAPTRLTLTIMGWANAAPAGARTVGLKLRTRQTASAGAPGAWSAATQLTDIAVAATRNLVVQSQTITFATLGLNASRHVQFELTRATPSGGTNLVDTFDLVAVVLELLP